MECTLTERFQRDVRTLSAEERMAVFDVMLRIPAALKDVHQHTGVGLRKLHASGIFEARAGLHLRIVFGYRQQAIILDRVGTHDDIRRYLNRL